MEICKMYKTIEINDFRQFKNQKLFFGKYLTVLSGRNSTGKSTILGMVANSGELKKKDGETYSSKAFRAEFSELFKGSQVFDHSGPNRFSITICDEDGRNLDYRSFRTAWQQTGKSNHSSRGSKTQNENLNGKRITQKSKCTYVSQNRFRVIPFKKLDDGKRTEAKFEYPVIYLGLSRLFPLGESHDESISNKQIRFVSEEHRSWFVENYKKILSMQTDIEGITNYSISETDKKSGIGVSTDYYDYLTNSSGQDNLGQILLALLSFRKLREEQGERWRGGILLIDEIDATLHPAAQLKLIKLFLQEARNNNLQIMVTTHSISFLQEICKKTAHNFHEENNNCVELYYFTNANRKLEIKRNPSIFEIENDLTISSLVQSRNEVKLYSEDKEARWFLRHLVPEYLNYVEIIESTIGCDQLINLYNADMQYFGNALIVLDGDVTEKQLKKIPDNVRENLGNIIKLPGDKSPERILYEYLMSLDPEHDFWERGSKFGFTWDYFKEHGPDSGSYTGEKNRDKYKQWFIAHVPYFDNIKLMDFWIKDNSELVQEFRDNFCRAYNHIAKRTMVMPLQENENK